MMLAATRDSAPAILARRVAFADIEGWGDDEHAAALAVFSRTIPDGPDWAPARAGLATEGARSYFQTQFQPVLIGTPPALFTGYYEPVLMGSRQPDARFRYPLYARPSGLTPADPGLTRQVIETGALSGRGLELVWLDDPAEAFFLHVQGSGRIRFPDGAQIRLGYAGQNGHPYRSIGKALIAAGAFSENDITAEAVKAWIRAHPEKGRALMLKNPSYVFFRRLDDLAPDLGPIGTSGVSVTAMRSLAVDPAFVPLGAPVWISVEGPRPLCHLAIAQDTGGAIKGPQRADIFFGTGPDAGLAAGALKAGGQMVVFLPHALADRSVAGV